MQITFLGQSSFCVDTGAQLLLFDYAPRLKRRAAEPVLLELLKDRTCTVFVSHVHEDHFSPEIYRLPNCRYVVAAGVPAEQDALVVLPEREYTLEGLEIKTFRSTDEGVAFLVEADGKTVYHAGDLHWWHWEGEPDPWNPDMECAFREQAEKIARETIDLAFLPTDQRQKAAWLWGMDLLMRQGNIAAAVPMHFWNQASVPPRILRDPCTAPYREKLHLLCRIGEQTSL